MVIAILHMKRFKNGGECVAIAIQGRKKGGGGGGGMTNSQFSYSTIIVKLMLLNWAKFMYNVFF